MSRHQNTQLKSRFGMRGMVAERILPRESIDTLERTKAAIPPELTKATVIRGKTTLKRFEKAPPCSRHDPSNIVRHKGIYYVWWMERDQVLDDEGKVVSCKLPWRLAFATSPDSLVWTYRGAALPHGAPSEWDDQGFAAPFCVPHKGRYYLFYNPTGTSYPEPLAHPGAGWRGLSYAVADTPEGPWRKHDKPILSPSTTGDYDEYLIACTAVRF